MNNNSNLTAEAAYKSGLEELAGRVGEKSWQVAAFQAWWSSCHLCSGISSKGLVVNSSYWDLVGKLDGEKVADVVNWLLGDQGAFDCIPIDRVTMIRRLKKKLSIVK